MSTLSDHRKGLWLLLAMDISALDQDKKNYGRDKGKSRRDSSWFTRLMTYSTQTISEFSSRAKRICPRLLWHVVEKCITDQQGSPNFGADPTYEAIFR